MDPTYVIAGSLRRDTILPPTGRPLVDIPGGNLLYAAAGLAVWDGGIGLLARAGEDYPHEWLRRLELHGFDTRGILLLPERIENRFFVAYPNPTTPQKINPMGHFARLGLAFPKSLLGYQPPPEQQDDRNAILPGSPRPGDIPADYCQASAVLLCPMDFMAHNRLVPAFQQARTSTIALDPGAGYMLPAFLDDMRSLLKGVTAFLPSEEEVRNLFRGRSDDLWEMAEALAGAGCEQVIIKRGGHGQMLYEADTRRHWEIPAYPAEPLDPTGAGDAFCGGFLAGYKRTYNPLQAVLYGNISASLTIEGSGVFHALEVIPGLAQARLESLANLVRRI